MRYSIEFQPSARKALADLPRAIQIRIGKALNGLAENPHPHNSKKLSGEHGVWRIRVGDYRILYTVETLRLVIWVLKIGHRRDVYH